MGDEFGSCVHVDIHIGQSQQCERSPVLGKERREGDRHGWNVD